MNLLYFKEYLAAVSYFSGMDFSIDQIGLRSWVIGFIV